MDTTIRLPIGIARFLLVTLVAALIVLAVAAAPGPQRAAGAQQGAVPVAPPQHPTMSGEFLELPFV